jgi:hypothetical protein
MTEVEWLDEANCVRLLEFLEERFDDELSLDGKDLDGSYNAIQRKLALFGCACCRLHWNRITKNDLRQSIEATEQLAEGLLEVEEWRQAIKSDDEEGDTEWEATVRGVGLSTGMTYVPKMQFMLEEFIRLLEDDIRIVADAERLHLSVLRCVFGNPFHPITLSPSWLTSTVVSLANQMYDSRDFSAMPILADALMDAGCSNEAILEHCRGPGPHVRGCWVCDLCLNKS